MAKTIFFSWQSDTPFKVGKGFLRDVLDEVCANLANETDVDEAHREVQVDSDTQGVAGQPPIVDTIFKKIDAAGVFIADMTFTGVRLDKRSTPNPNVLIEYGWALKSLTHSRVLCVMNDAYGEPSHYTLPFDLSHLRWPIRYTLPENATSEVKKVEKKKLVATLTGAIKISLATIAVTPPQEPDSFPLAHALTDRARFRAPNQALGFEYDNFHNEPSKEVFLSTGPAMWLRLMPAHDINKTWAPHELKSFLIENSQLKLFPLYSRAGGYGQLRSEDGVGIYAGKPHDKGSTSIETDSVAFVFETGEIWSIDMSTLFFSGNNFPFIEDIYSKSLKEYSLLLKNMGIQTPLKWMAGIMGVKGRSLYYPVQQGYNRIGNGPICASDVIFEEGTYDGEETTTTALMPFFKKIFDKCGLPRPDYLPQ